MTNYMRMLALTALVSGYAASAMGAGSPEGEWLVKDKTAHMRIVRCDNALWGTISWAKNPGIDENNPDSSKRNLSVIGLPILLGMREAKDGWKGDIYNADNGKTYHGGIALKSENVLHIEGCVMGGIFCGGENWTRITTVSDKSLSPALVCQEIKKRLE